MKQYLVTGSRELGELLRGLRKAQGWTQVKLAERAGVLPKTVSALEIGTGNVRVATLIRCLSALEAELLIASRAAAPGHEKEDPAAPARHQRDVRERW